MRDFIERHTVVGCAPLVPEVRLHLASEITPVWQATEAWLEREGLSPPFWAFAWPGSQVLARHVLDHPSVVAGRRVLDFAAGCGLAGIACAMAGAGRVEAAEVDAVAIEATRLNAALNGVVVEGSVGDVVGGPGRWDVILCGDVCYEAPMAARIVPWLRGLARGGAEVLMADPGRAYLPAEGLEVLGTWAVPTSLELEDKEVRTTRLLRVLP